MNGSRKTFAIDLAIGDTRLDKTLLPTSNLFLASPKLARLRFTCWNIHVLFLAQGTKGRWHVHNFMHGFNLISQTGGLNLEVANFDT